MLLLCRGRGLGVLGLESITGSDLVLDTLAKAVTSHGLRLKAVGIVTILQKISQHYFDAESSQPMADLVSPRTF